VGHLWASDGTLLATATFANETATGWQEVGFSSPVAIAANTTYIASYFAPVGHYSYNSAYFASTGVNSSPLTALANGVDGGNGVYRLATGGGFPNQSFNSNNYWVDVAFNSTVQNTTPPGVVGLGQTPGVQGSNPTPAPGATAVPVTTTVTATFTESVQANTISFVLKDAAGNTVTSSVSYNDAAWTATLTPSASLTTSTTYTATVSGVTDAAGNTMTSPVSWSFTTVGAASGSTIWTSSVTPSITSANDSTAQELGVKFRSSVAGYITGIQFYKGTGNTGTHVGHLWTSTGTLLATATLRQRDHHRLAVGQLLQPRGHRRQHNLCRVLLRPGGALRLQLRLLRLRGRHHSPLTALANGVDGGNGLYAGGNVGVFPNQTYNSNNYWVDVTFSTTVQDTTPAHNRQPDTGAGGDCGPVDEHGDSHVQRTGSG